MEKMSTMAAGGCFFLGWVWFLLWLALAIWGPWCNKIIPPVTPQKFLNVVVSAPRQPQVTQYDILYGLKGNPPFDQEHPNPNFALNSAQQTQLTNWGFNDCVKKDGTAGQDTGFLSGSCFCENAPAVKAIFGNGFAVQPSNTFSTFSLSIVGLILLGFLVFADPPEQQNFMTGTYFFGLCYAAMTIILGPFSMMLHMGLRNWGGWCDSCSLYIWFGFVACYGGFRFIVACLNPLRRMNSLPEITPDSCPRWAKLVFLGAWLGVFGLVAGLTVPGTKNPNFLQEADNWYLILGGLALLGEFFLWLWNVVGFTSSPKTSWAPSGADAWYSNLPWDTGGRTWFLVGGITFFLALTIWVLSFTRKPLCSPSSPIQGHAVFHTLSAFAAGFLYKYYRHEGEVQS
jgi:hypothetical protein